jgi:hypothetical protein
MSTQYRLVQSGKTASGGCSAGQGSSEPVAPRTDATSQIFQLQISPKNLLWRKKHFPTQTLKFKTIKFNKPEHF